MFLPCCTKSFCLVSVLSVIVGNIAANPTQYAADVEFCNQYPQVTDCGEQEEWSIKMPNPASNSRLSTWSIQCSTLYSFDEYELLQYCGMEQVLSKCSCTCKHLRTCPVAVTTVAAAPFECFGADSMVDTNRGPMTIRTLRKAANISVLTLDTQNRPTFSPVQLWLHATPVDATFVEISMNSGHSLEVTRNHLVYVVPCNGGPRRAIPAEDVKVGHCLLVLKGESLRSSAVQSIRAKVKNGIYGFTTQTGSVIVDGVAASAYGGTRHEEVAHWFFTLAYRVFSFLPQWCVHEDTSGLHPVVNAIGGLVSAV